MPCLDRLRNKYQAIFHRFLRITPSKPCAPDVHTLHFHILSQTFQQTLSAQSTTLPATERQVPASRRTRAIYTNHTALQLRTHTEGTLEVFGVQTIKC
jgi:hypothetical protein